MKKAAQLVEALLNDPQAQTDPSKVPMTPEWQQEVLADFAEWSGGFAPDEVNVKDIETYIGAAASLNFGDEAQLEEFLINYKGEKPAAAPVPPSVRRG